MLYMYLKIKHCLLLEFRWCLCNCTLVTNSSKQRIYIHLVFAFVADIFSPGEVYLWTRCTIVGPDHIPNCCSCLHFLHLCCQKVDGSLFTSLGNIGNGCRCCIHSLCEFSLLFTHYIYIYICIHSLLECRQSCSNKFYPVHLYAFSDYMSTILELFIYEKKNKKKKLNTSLQDLRFVPGNSQEVLDVQ